MRKQANAEPHCGKTRPAVWGMHARGRLTRGAGFRKGCNSMAPEAASTVVGLLRGRPPNMTLPAVSISCGVASATAQGSNAALSALVSETDTPPDAPARITPPRDVNERCLDIATLSLAFQGCHHLTRPKS